MAFERSVTPVVFFKYSMACRRRPGADHTGIARNSISRKALRRALYLDQVSCISLMSTMAW